MSKEYNQLKYVIIKERSKRIQSRNDTTVRQNETAEDLLLISMTQLRTHDEDGESVAKAVAVLADNPFQI